MNVSRKAQRVVNRYLARVERALGHLDSAERREIVDGLRTHIHESLSDRGANPAQAEDVRAVLSTMDAPQGFGDENSLEASITAGRSHTLGRLGFYAVVGGAALLVLALLLGATVAESLLRGGIVLSGILAICGLGLGLAGWRSPLGKAAVICAILALAAGSFLLPARVSTSQGSSPQPVVESHSAP